MKIRISTKFIRNNTRIQDSLPNIVIFIGELNGNNWYPFEKRNEQRNEIHEQLMECCISIVIRT